jgi:hypothetical protein
MKVKSIMLMVIILVTGIMFAAYSTKAQKSESEKAKDDKAYQKILEQKKQIEIERNRVIPQEELMAEIGKSAICTTLYQNMLSKEKDQWSIKHIGCHKNFSFSFIEMQKNKEDMNITILAQATSEIAKSALKDTPGRTAGVFFPSNEFGDDGFKQYDGVPVDKSASKGVPLGILFIKGRFMVHISCRGCESEEPFNHFAEYTLTALEGQ